MKKFFLLAIFVLLGAAFYYKVLQPGQVEFVLGVIAAHPPGGVVGEDAVGAHHRFRVRVTHQQVLAKRVVEV